MAHFYFMPTSLYGKMLEKGVIFGNEGSLVTGASVVVAETMQFFDDLPNAFLITGEENLREQRQKYDEATARALAEGNKDIFLSPQRARKISKQL